MIDYIRQIVRDYVNNKYEEEMTYPVDPDDYKRFMQDNVENGENRILTEVSIQQNTENLKILVQRDDYTLIITNFVIKRKEPELLNEIETVKQDENVDLEDTDLIYETDFINKRKHR